MSDELSLITSLASAGSGLYGAWLNKESQDKVNRESARQFDESLRFQKYTYEDAKKYNSAVAQVARLRQAGLNPALAFGSGNAGSISAGTSPASTAQMGSVDYTPMAQQLGTAISDGLNASLIKSSINKTDAETAKDNSDTQLNLIDALTRASENQLKLKSIGSNVNLNREMVKLRAQENEFLQKTMKNRVLQEELKARRFDLENEALEINNAWLPATIAQDLASKMAAAKAALMSGNASWLQARAAMKQALTSEAVMEALQGATPDERKQFWQMNMQYLFEQKKTERTKQFANLDAPESTSIGSDNFGHVTRSSVNNRGTSFAEWDSQQKGWSMPEKVKDKNGKWRNTKKR